MKNIWKVIATIGIWLGAGIGIVFSGEKAISLFAMFATLFVWLFGYETRQEVLKDEIKFLEELLDIGYCREERDKIEKRIEHLKSRLEENGN